jgi:hypothetical protein
MSASSKNTMTAPASTAYRIIDVPEPYEDVIKRRGVLGTYVSALESDSPWVPFGVNAAIRHLAFDVRRNEYANVLWIKSKGVIGTHRHRGTVVMLCLEGSARYLEYDWVAGPGDFITETPGQTHTLVSDHPDGVKLFGWLQGATEYFDENGNFTETLDIWWFINHYESYCREQGIAINEQLYL